LSEDTIEVGDLGVYPSFDRALKPIHPAIGMIDDTAYVGVWIPSLVRDKEGNESERDLLYLITDSHKAILANDKVLAERGWRLAYRPILFENRWPLQDVKNYLNERSSRVDPVTVLLHVVDPWFIYMELPASEEYFYEGGFDVGTYCYHLFNSFPYRYLGGIKRVGKSKDLTLHSCLAFNAVFSNNMSVSSIFRLIQNARSTLLIDETEKLRNPDRAQEFRSILLAGYKKGEKVYRVEKNRKEQLVPEAFEVYAPKVLANIGGIEDVLEDRCKVTFLKRSINRAIADREIDVNGENWPQLRSEVFRLYLDWWRDIKACYDKLNKLTEDGQLVGFLKTCMKDTSESDFECLTARELELWKPILALALFFDSKDSSGTLARFLESKGLTGSLCASMLKLAIEDAKSKQTENLTETSETLLVQVLVDLVQSTDWYSVKVVKAEMVSRLDEEAKWLTNEWLGRALRRLGFREKRRLGPGVQYKLGPEQVESLALRFGIVKEVKDMHEVYPLGRKDMGGKAEPAREGSFTSEGTQHALLTQPTPEASGKLPCEVCGSHSAKMHLIPNRGVKWLCDRCLESCPEKV